MKKLLGIQTGTSKKGNYYAIVFYSAPLERDGGTGELCDKVFLNNENDVNELLKQKPVGKVFDFVYGEVYGKPAVVGIKLN